MNIHGYIHKGCDIKFIFHDILHDRDNHHRNNVVGMVSEVGMISKTLLVAIISFLIPFLKLTKILGKTLTLEGLEVPIALSSSTIIFTTLTGTLSKLKAISGVALLILI
jgi:hypothetical protein